MKVKIQEIADSIFSISLIVAILGGGVIFIMFMVAMILGGASGEALATNAKNVVMPYFIRAAAVAVLCGLASIYATGKHPLSLEEE